MSGYRALHESAAWTDISERGQIRVTGEDRVHFLHAMCSNDVESLEPGQGTRAFFLDARGHIQADGHIFVAPDHILLDCEPDRREALQEHLDRFIVMDDVALEDISGSQAVLALEGPNVEEAARKTLQTEQLPAENYAHVVKDDLRIIRCSVTGQPGLWLFVEAEKKTNLAAQLEAAGAVAAAPLEVRTVRVENQIPRQGDDYADSLIPQQTQQLEAFSFTKGCYLGQEIVERVRARGQVQKLLAGLELNASTPPPEGAGVYYGEKEVGRLTSPVFSPRMGRVVAFSILRREAAAPGTQLRVNGCEARVRPRDGNGSSTVGSP